MDTTEQKQYYATRRNEIFRNFDLQRPLLESALTGKMNATDIATLIEAVRADLDAQIALAPCIGGDANRLTDIYVGLLWMLPFHRRARSMGLDMDTIGGAIYKVFELTYDNMNLPDREAIADKVFSTAAIERIEREAGESKLKRYEFDWVYDFIPGDGVTLDFGFDYLECGLHKYLNAQGAGELVPYLCRLDWVKYGAIGAGLQRTTTVADGAPRCDFRFKRGRPTVPTGEGAK